MQAGALSSSVTIGVAQVPIPSTLPTGMSAAGNTFAFTPHGTTFLAPVTIRLPYAGSADTVLRLDNEQDTSWEPIEGATFASGVVTFTTSRFSLFIVVNQCQPLCSHAATVCDGGTADTTHGTCLSACTRIAAKGRASCPTERGLLRDCLIDAGSSSEFACSVDRMPLQTTCPSQRSALQTCVTTANGGCPCFAVSDLEMAYKEAKDAGVTGVGPASTDPTDGGDWGGCAYGQEPDASFGSLTTVNSAVFAGLFRDGGTYTYSGINDGGANCDGKITSEAYFSWYGVGPVSTGDGGSTPKCFVWKGDSCPVSYALEVYPALDVVSTQQNACIQVINQFKNDGGHPPWTCTVQH